MLLYPSFSNSSHNTLKRSHRLFHRQTCNFFVKDTLLWNSGWNWFQHLCIRNVSLHKSHHPYTQLGHYGTQNCHHYIRFFWGGIFLCYIHAVNSCVDLQTALPTSVCFCPVNLLSCRPKACMLHAGRVSPGLLGHHFRSRWIVNVWHSHVHQ